MLAQRARDQPPGRGAGELADRAYEFRRTAEDRSARDAEVKESFERLSRSYHALRDEVERSDSREARIDLKPVTESYLDVEREMEATLSGRLVRTTGASGIDTQSRAAKGR
jgi:hypothetical protein